MWSFGEATLAEYGVNEGSVTDGEFVGANSHNIAITIVQVFIVPM